jgi:CubicO group peptidase (beta-lactamase class C family)
VTQRTEFRGRRFNALILLLMTFCWACDGDAADTHAWLIERSAAQMDATLGDMINERRSSFAAGIFVKDGRVAFAKTYGVEAPASSQPLSLDSTLFDLNSITKIFTAIAIAQLVERGSIASIDDPINRYLKHFKLPLAFGHEVTIRAVATHTSGLDETAFGADAQVSDPAAFFASRFPGYVPNPELFSSYDSYGPRLLAYMVSEITGRPFKEYVDHEILFPLGMSHTFLAAPPEPLAHRAVAFAPKLPSQITATPALDTVAANPLGGAAVSTLSDMARLMTALLTPADDQLVITPPMRELLFRVLQSNGEYGSGHGLLFDELRSGPTRLFVHGGVGPGVRCMLALDVRRQAGLFYCYGYVRSRFIRDPALTPPEFEVVTDQMLRPFVECRPDEESDCTHYPAAAWREEWNDYLGYYVDIARHHHGFSRLRTLIHPIVVRVTRAGDSLRLDDKPDYVEIAPGVFGNPHYLETLSFIKDAARGGMVLSVSDRPSVYEKPGPLEDPRVMLPLLGTLVLLALSGGVLVIWPAYGVSRGVRLAAAAYAAIVGISVAIIFGLSAYGQRYFLGIAWPLDVLRICAFLTIPASLALLGVAYRATQTYLVGLARWGRVHFALIAVSSVIMVLTLITVELIGFSRIT